MQLFLESDVQQALFRLPLKKQKTRYFRKIEKKNRYRSILDAINGLGISIFSDTSDALSLCIFELFNALNFATSNILSFDVSFDINFATSNASSVNSLFFGIKNESKKNRYQYRYQYRVSFCPKIYRNLPDIKLSIP